MKILLFSIFITFSIAGQRIVTLSPAINEIVYALGAGDKVVGNTEYCTYPKTSSSVTKVGGYFNPNLEKILSLQPTIVIMQQNNLKLGKQLNKLGIKTKIVKIDRLHNIKSSILTLGKLIDKSSEAKNIVDDIESHLAALKGIVTHKKILIVIGHNTSLVKQIFVVGQNLYFDDIINSSGNHNALQSKRKGQPILNQENIIATNPDIVILLAPFMKEKGLTPQDLIAPWKELPIRAGREDQIYIIGKKYAGVPSDRLVLFLKDFKEILNAVKNH